MAPREGCPLRSAGDWCSRLSWPGTPVTSFRWGRVVTITVSPGGAASPARRDAPRRSSGIPCVRTATPGSVAEAPPPPTGTFHAAGCVSFRAGAFDAVGDSNPVPQRVICPRPCGNVPARAGCPRPLPLSAGCSCPVPRHRCVGRASIAATRLPRQGVTRLLAVTRMAPVIYCTRVGCHWRRVGCTPGRWGLRAVRTTPGQ